MPVFPVMCIGGGEKSGPEAEGGAECTHRDPGLGGGRGGYAS